MRKHILLASVLCLLLVAVLAFSVFADTTPTVYLDGSAANGGDGTQSAPVNTLEKAVALLPDGGKIVLTGDVTVGSRYYAFPAANGKLTVTSEGYGKQIKFSYNNTTFLQFTSEVEFENITLNRTYDNYIEIATGPSLTFGENVQLLFKGNIVAAGANRLIVRLGYNEHQSNSGVSYPTSCENASFTMLSGTINYVQGGNKWTPVTGTSTITLGEDATLMDFVQLGGTESGSKDVAINNVVVYADGATFPKIHLGGYGSATITGNVTVTLKNMSNFVLDGQRPDTDNNLNDDGKIAGNLDITLENCDVTSAPLNITTVNGNLSLTMDNSNVAGLTGLDSSKLGGTVSMTLKNYEKYYPTINFAGVDALNLVDSAVYVSSAYEGPASITADADSIMKFSGLTNDASDVPAVTGGGSVVLVAAGSYIPGGDPISMKYDDRLDVSQTMLVEIVDPGTPTSDKVGYGVAEGAKDDAVITYDESKKQLIATGIGTATVAIDGVTHEITVEKAKISMFLLIGQSNMAGAEGNKNQSIICPDGQVYSTYGSPSNDYYSTGLPALTGSNGASFVASALAGSGALTARDGNTANMATYPIGAFAEDGPGKIGMDSGIGYELNKLSGEKVWLVNAAHGGTRIAQWVPGGSEYTQAVGLFKQAQETMKAEIAAGHYELTYMGYFWCQGCADRIQTTEYYLNMYDSMHQQLKIDLAFDFNGDGDKTDSHEVLESANIVLVRACGTDGYSSQYDGKTKEYFDYRDLQMNGVRTAQYYMANSNETKFADVHMVCNLGDSWVYWDLEHTQDDVKEIFAARYPNGIDYKIQVGTMSMPQNQMTVHDSIHYNQIGYNEIGREAGRNFYYRANPDKQPDETVSIKLYAWDGVEDLAGKNETKILTEGQTVVPVVYPLYQSKSLTVSGLDYDYYELNGTRGGTVTATAGNVSVSYTLTPATYTNVYRWETVNGAFANVTGEGLSANALSLITGTNANGTLTDAGFRLENSIVLLHDVPWAIEWQGAVKSSASNSTAFMLFASSASSNTLNAPYMFVSNHGIILGERNDAMGDDKNAFHHREAYSNITLTNGQPVYRLVNEITATGNMVYLYIDGVKIGAVDNNGTDSWVNGQDFVFSHIGARSTTGMTTTTDAKAEAYNHTLTGTMDHLQVWENRMVAVAAKDASCTENGNVAHYLDTVTGKTYSDALGTTEIPDVTIPASHTMIYNAADPSNCLEDGTVEYWHCSVCNKNFGDEAGANELDSIVDEADGHDLFRFPADPSDCTNNGTIEYWHCNTCNKNFKEEAGITELTDLVDPMDGHDMKRVDAEPSNCTENGNIAHWHCDTCNKNFADEAGATELDSIVDTADGHDMTHHAADPSSCTENGTVEYWSCGTCNKNFADEAGTTELTSIVDESDGHDMTHHAADPSNCTEDGTVEYWSCGTCNKNFADEAGTTELDSIVDTADGHDMTHHDAVPSNCTEDGNIEHWSCGTCDKYFADEAGTTVLDSILDPKDGHDLTKVDEEPATADKAGKEEHWVCDECEKLFSDAEGETEVEEADLVIPALGHEVETEVETGVVIEGLENAVHGESYTFTVELEEGYVKGENFKVMVNGKELKANADGSYTIVSVTGKLEISVTGAVKQNIIPDTGDETLILPVLILMTLSALGITVLYGKKYRFIP